MNFLLEMRMDEPVGSEYFFDVFVKIEFVISQILKGIKLDDQRERGELA